MKQIKGPDGAPLIRHMGCPSEPITAPAQGAGPPDGPVPLLSKQTPREKGKLYYFIIIEFFLLPTENSYF